MDQIVLASEAWQVACCQKYKRKARGQSFKRWHSKSRVLT